MKKENQLLKEIADVNWTIIRGHGRRQREKIRDNRIARDNGCLPANRGSQVLTSGKLR